MMRNFLRVSCFSLGLSLLSPLGLVFAEAPACLSEPAKSAQDMLDELKRVRNDKFLQDSRNCGHPGFAAKVNVAKPTVDKATEKMFSTLDAKMVTDLIEKATEHRIDFMVPGSGTMQPIDLSTLGMKPSQIELVKSKLKEVSGNGSTTRTRIIGASDSLSKAIPGESPEHRAPLYVEEIAKLRSEASKADSQKFISSLKEDKDLNEKIKSVAQNKACVNGFKLNLVAQPYQWNTLLGKVKSTAGIDGEDITVEKARELITAENQKFYNDPYKVLRCTEPVLSRAKLVEQSVKRSYPVKVEGHFLDNQSEMTNPDQFLSEIKDQLHPTRAGCDTIVKGAQIAVSSNLNRNNCEGFEGQALSDCLNGEKDSSYDFLGLSEKRAEKIKKVLSRGFDRPGSAPIAFSTNTRGENGDGTSGKCPYRVDPNTDKVRKMTPKEFEKKWGLDIKSLDDAKYVHLNVEAEEKCPPSKNSKDTEQAYMGRQCFDVQVECTTTAAK